MAGIIPSPNTLTKKDDDDGYIVGWKKKYAFEAGKFTDEVMTYGEAKKKAAELSARDSERVFWPELLAANPHL